MANAGVRAGMTVGEMLNTFIQQFTSMYVEADMEKPATMSDWSNMLHLITTIGRAMASRIPVGEEGV